MKVRLKRKPELSIVILSFNVRELLINCLKSIYNSKPQEEEWQVIVVDNASTDGTVKAVRKAFSQVRVVVSKKNLGFAAGNNIGVKLAKAEWVLFLNPDTLVVGNAVEETLRFAKGQSRLGVVTCKVQLPDGRLDYSCHRGLPTPWNAFYYFMGLARLFPHLKLTTGYTATYQDMSKPHEIELGSGTFFLVRRKVGDKVGWWDEDYFWNGEDVEFCFRVRQKGWKIYYYPHAEIIHYKGSSSGLWSTAKVQVSRETKLKSATAAAAAMRIFYRKHYLSNHSSWWPGIVETGIDLLEKIRLLKLKRGWRYE